jgi:hypothetical protein
VAVGKAVRVGVALGGAVGVTEADGVSRGRVATGVWVAVEGCQPVGVGPSVTGGNLVAEGSIVTTGLTVAVAKDCCASGLSPSAAKPRQ